MSARWNTLVRSFPTLRGYPGSTPQGLDDWASGRGLGSGALCAVRFVLGVWDHNRDWMAGRFDLFQAIRTWDPDHLKAFQAWAADPFQA